MKRETMGRVETAMKPYEIRKAAPDEWAAADRIADRAFHQYEAEYPQWVAALRNSRPMTRLGEIAEVDVAISGAEMVGACGYVAPGHPRYDFFPRQWSVLRMLSVPPEYRGQGIGRALVEECIRLSIRDGADVLGLYTSPIMKAAVPLYRSMGFVFQRNLPPEMGVPCVIYTLALDPRPAAAGVAPP
jgi:ribosomal protein S18 acetylase RimI-like enzyme